MDKDTDINKDQDADTKQNVKIAEAHGFNIGAVSAAPLNGSGLHSHTTAEVFLIFSGSWRFYWGTDGKEGEVILSKLFSMSLLYSQV